MSDSIMHTARLFLLAVVGAWLVVGCSGTERGVEDRGPGPVVLQPSSGQVFELETELDQTMEMTVMNQTVEIRQQMTERSEWLIDTVYADGSFKAQVTTKRFRFKQEGPGVFEEYDTSDPDAASDSGMNLSMGALTDVPMQLRVTPTADVTVLDGMDAWYNNIVDLAGAETAAQRDTLRTMMREAMPPDEMAKDLESNLYLYTQTPVAPGSTWTTTASSPSILPIAFDATVRLDSLTQQQLFLQAEGAVRIVDSGDGIMTRDNAFSDLDLIGSQTMSYTLHRKTGVPLVGKGRRTLSGTGIIRSGGNDLDVRLAFTATISVSGSVPAPLDTARSDTAGSSR